VLLVGAVLFTACELAPVAIPGGEEREIERTTTTEFKNVGSTKMAVPEEAKKKLGA